MGISISLLAAFAVAAVLQLFATVKLLMQLRKEQHETWVSLGSPTLTNLAGQIITYRYAFGIRVSAYPSRSIFRACVFVRISFALMVVTFVPFALRVFLNQGLS